MGWRTYLVFLLALIFCRIFGARGVQNRGVGGRRDVGSGIVFTAARSIDPLGDLLVLGDRGAGKWNQSLSKGATGSSTHVGIKPGIQRLRFTSQ